MSLFGFLLNFAKKIFRRSRDVVTNTEFLIHKEDLISSIVFLVAVAVKARVFEDGKSAGNMPSFPKSSRKS